MILAMSADGKIADVTRSPTRFSSKADRIHLEKQVALADGVLFGAGTLRAYGTTLGVSNPEWLQLRKQRGVPPQPVQIVCSRLAELDPQLRFFRQEVPRWLLTTETGAKRWQEQEPVVVGAFERIIVANTSEQGFDWIDEFWLTVCPLIVGGRAAPTPVDGEGFSAPQFRHLELLNVQTIEQEVFLHYRMQHGS
jgi:5-amino-6-(5-phosphoribosylamino)uracil reductase